MLRQESFAHRIRTDEEQSRRCLHQGAIDLQEVGENEKDYLLNNALFICYSYRGD